MNICDASIRMFILAAMSVFLSGHSMAQDTALVNGYPAVSGVMVLDAQGNTLGYYLVSGIPSDIEILPNSSEFVVVTTAGSFLVYNSSGQLIFDLNFPNLIDVDAVDNENNFLLTSRYGNTAFLFDRSTGQQREIPYEFTGPSDADLLANGNLLICEAQTGRIIEITQNGRLVWEYRNDLKQPMDALRLSNGNTLISDFDNHRVIEVDPQGALQNIYTGFDHPRKLTQMASGDILVADSDHQRLAKITTTGQVETVRENINYIKSAVVLPGDGLILALIEAKFPPPTPAPTQSQIQTSTEASWYVGFSDYMFSPYVLLTLALILWAFAVRFREKIPATHAWLISAYAIVIGVAFHYQTLAASAPEHRPQPVFWLATLLLAIFAFREARLSFRPRETWQSDFNQFHFPLSIGKTFFLLIGTALPILFQYLHVHREFPNWPWYYPMLVWIVVLYWFFKWMLYSLSSKSTFNQSFWQNLPFTAGSVGSYGYTDDPDSNPYNPPTFQLTKQTANQIVLWICILAGCLYMIGTTEVPTDFHGDEAEVAMHGIKIRDQGNWSFFVLGWYNIPNLFYLIPAWVMWLFGDNQFGIRMAGALTGLATIPIFYLLARRLLYLSPAVIATFLFATSTYFVHFSRIGIGYNQTTLLTVLSLYLWVRGIQTRDARFVCLAGFSAGIGMMSYQATHILLPLILASFGLVWILQMASLKRIFLATLAFLFGYWIAMSPLMGNYFYNPGASISRANSVTVFSEAGRNLIQGEYYGEQTISEMLQGQFERTLLAPISYQDRSPYLVNAVSGGLLDPIPAILLVSGVLILLFRINHPAGLLLLFWAFTTLILGSAFTNRAPSYQRMVGLHPWLILIAAPVLHGILRHISGMGKWTLNLRATVTALVLGILLIMSTHRYFHQIQSEPQLLEEWTRIARYLDEAGPTHYTYFFGPPHIWFEYGTIQFLAQEAKGENVQNPERFLQQRIQRRGPVTFLLVRSNRQYLPKLRSLYPGGIEQHWKNNKGENPFTTYTVYF